MLFAIWHSLCKTIEMSQIVPSTDGTEKIADKSDVVRSSSVNSTPEASSPEEGEHGKIQELEVDLGEVIEEKGEESWESEHSPFPEGSSPETTSIALVLMLRQSGLLFPRLTIRPCP